MSEKKEDVKLSTREERILTDLLEKGVRELKPLRAGHKVTYTDLDEVANDLSEKNKKKLLKSLTIKGYLKEKEFDASLICPNCESTEIYTRHNCPSCKSINIQKNRLVEHTKCGFMGNINDFEKDDQLICPKCKAVIYDSSNVGYKQTQIKMTAAKNIGSSFTCNNCGSIFDKPLTTHICTDCSASFNSIEADYERFPVYELTEKVDTLTTNNSKTNILRQLEKIIQTKGYTVELNAKIKGKSGLEQAFDLIAKKGDEIMLLDVSSWGNQKDLTELLGKKTDVRSSSVTLIDLTGNQNLVALGKLYSIAVLDGRDGEKLGEAISRILPEKVEKNSSRLSFLRRGK